MGFFAAIGSGFRKYAVFSGRASRSEYWYFTLFVALLALLSAALVGTDLIAVPLLPVLLPAITVEVRRLHDLDRSGWWWWIGAIPLLGPLIKIGWYCRGGTIGENKYGSDPLATPKTTSFTGTPESSMTETAEQLSKIKGLLDSGTITQEEFDRMKARVLAS